MNWVLYKRIVFLTALEAGGLRLGYQQGVCEGHIQFADFSFCPYRVEGAEGSSWSLFYKDINLTTALPSSPPCKASPPDPITSGNRISKHWNSGGVHADQAPSCFRKFYRGSLTPLSAATQEAPWGLRAADLEVCADCA